ncbi:MAG: DUF5343 domain-containing protein [Sphingomonadales bacterium]
MATTSKSRNRSETTDQSHADASKVANAAPRKIPGNLPYLTASGTLKKALDRLIEASRPDKFNYDFLENVLKLKGGSARATVPILKRTGFLSSDGTPTDLYGRFRTEGGRGSAAFQALKIGFPEIFKRSEYAHSVEETKLRDIIVEITGLKSSAPVAKAIKGTFNVIKSYIPTGMGPNSPDEEFANEEPTSPAQIQAKALVANPSQGHGSQLGLTYNINVVLPETSDLRVLNAIFRSLKDNLL